MRKTIELTLFSLVCVSAALGHAQQQRNGEEPPSQVQLDLSIEVATTDADGNPSSIRTTLKNIGEAPVDLPMADAGCVVGGGGMQIMSRWEPAVPNPEHGYGSGGMMMCGADHFPPLSWRIEHEWIHLRPGEWITQTISVRREFRVAKPGTLDMWAEYNPPELTAKEVAELRGRDMKVPCKKIESEHRNFPVR